MAAETFSIGTAAPQRQPTDGSAARAAPATRAIFRFRPASLALLVAVGAVLCIPFWKAIGWLWVTWTTQMEYSHGPILPLIAAFLVWQQKDKLEALEFKGDWRGTVVVALAGAAYFLGVIGAVYTLQQYAFVLAIAGLALALVGAGNFPRLLAPLAVLVLMVPQPSFILNNLSSNLQLLSSRIGVAFVRAAGISVFLEGNVIDLGTYRLQVVEACDGLRYLFPLMTIGILIAYFYKGAMWKRVTVFLASIPITVLMNSLRIGTIGVMVDRWGPTMAEGFLHEFQGWMVFMLSGALLLGLTALLNRVGREAAPWRQLFGVEFPAPAPPEAEVHWRALPASFTGAALVVGLIAIGGVALPQHAELVPAREPFATFPTALDGWSGRRGALDSDVRDWLLLDDYVLIDFARGAEPPVDFYASYYNSQRDRRVVHSPRACIPGAGWQIESMSQVTLAKPGLRVNRMVVANGDARQLVYYWFDQRGRDITNEFSVKWYLFWDALTRRRTDGAMVRLVTPLDRRGGEAAADARLAALAATIVPRLPRYIPE
jgi:exosortase D (VPLPA-CTERM-specific)